MMNIVYAYDRDAIKMDDFLKIEDEELKKYIYCEGRVERNKWEFYKIENKNKVGWYHKYCCLKVNNSGKIYKQSSLKEWIVYNKSKKEVAISTSTKAIKDRFLEDFFKNDFIISKCIPNITKTLVKKLVEEKIVTFSDLISYHKSYTIKNKNLSNECVARFISLGMSWVMGTLEDPEEFTTPRDFLLIEGCSSEYISLKFKKLKKEELINIQQTYANWRSEKSEKYAGLVRPRSTEISF